MLIRLWHAIQSTILHGWYICTYANIYSEHRIHTYTHWYMCTFMMSRHAYCDMNPRFVSDILAYTQEYAYICIYIIVSLILMIWHREAHINSQKGNRWIIVDPAGIELMTCRLRQLRQLPVVQHVRFMPLKLCLKTQFQWHARGCTGQLTSRLECTGVNFNTCVCTHIRDYGMEYLR